MRTFTFISATFIFLLFCTGCTFKSDNISNEGLNRENKPNIIFIIADDMYPDMLNFLPQGQGKNLTPTLDKLSGGGTVMLNQYVVSPVCTPSRYNCLTGQYASRATNESFLRHTRNEGGQTVIQWNTFITEGQKILPHYLKEQGYTTGMVGKNHVIEANGLHFFEDYHADPRQPDIKKKLEENYNKVKQAILNCGFDYADGIYHNNPNFIGLSELAVQNMDWIAKAGLDFIDQNHDKPFFLYFATTIPHGPTSPERSWRADPRITAKGYLDEAPDVLPPRQTLPDRIKEAGLEGQNKELILWLDDALTALMEKLNEHKIADNTIIFFFNDHGQKGKGTLYQGGVLNPSVVWKQGGFSCGKENTIKVQNIDFAPTILDFAGSDNVSSEFDGKSFLPVLQDDTSKLHESLFFELGYARAVIKGKYKYYAIRYPEYADEMTPEQRAERLEEYNDTRRFRDMEIVNEDPAAPFSHFHTIPGGSSAEHQSYDKKPGYFDMDQLYDLEADPHEQNNLAENPEYQHVLNDLKKELQNYVSSLPGQFEL